MALPDFLENHICYCIALLNEKGVQEMEEYQFDDYTENMYVERLSYKEAESIFRGVFDKINEKCDLFIGFFEEEDLPSKKLEEAKSVVEEFLKNEITEPQKNAAEKVLRVIQKAIDCKTYVCFEF